MNQIIQKAILSVSKIIRIRPDLALRAYRWLAIFIILIFLGVKIKIDDPLIIHNHAQKNGKKKSQKLQNAI